MSFKKYFSFILVLALLGSLSVSVSAASITQDNLDIRLETDKSAYAIDDPITGILTVTNSGGKMIEHVVLSLMVPEGYDLLDGQYTSTQEKTLKAGETAVLKVAFSPREPEPTEPTKESVKKSSGLSGLIFFPIGLATLAAAGLLISKSDIWKRFFSLFLCCAMLGGMLPLVPKADAAAETKTANISTTVDAGGFTVELRGSVTYAAAATAETFTVSFDTNGGSNVASQNVASGQPVRRPSSPTKSGYYFGGWYADPNLAYEYDFSAAVSGDMTLYAKWSAMSNNPNGTSTNNNSGNTGGSNSGTNTGTNNTTATQPTSAPTTSPTTSTNPAYYTVTFKSRGGSRVDPIEVREGRRCPEPDDPKQEGYVFDGWYTEKNLRNEYDFSEPVFEDITLYAAWAEEEELIVQFHSNGGSRVEPQYLYPGERASIPSDPTRSGYKFDGWYTDEDLEEEFDFRQRVNKDLDLYAAWTPIDDPDDIDDDDPDETEEESEEPKVYSITFHTDNGEEIEKQSVSSDDTLEIPEDPTKDGYEFIGWFTDEKLTKPFDPDSPITSDMNLYAKWEEVSAEMSRGEWISTLVHTLNLSASREDMRNAAEYYTDIDDCEYRRDILTAIACGLLTPEEGTEFAPDDIATREFAAATAAAWVGHKPEKKLQCDDLEDITEEPENIQSALEMDLIQLEDGQFLPERELRQSEIDNILDHLDEMINEN